MTNTLRDALRSIEVVGTHEYDTTGLAESVNPVVRRVARRRAVRAVGAGGAGLSVAAALVVGSGQVGFMSGSSDAAAETEARTDADSLGGDGSTGYFFDGPGIPSLQDCAGLPAVVRIFNNGELHPSALCWVTGTVALRADAAVAFGQMSDAFEAKFGQRLCVVDGYRDRSAQWALRQSSSSAPSVGTSEHGWGTTVDLCSLEAYPEMRAWVDAHAGDFGWVATVADEPWHLEFRPASEGSESSD